MMDKRYTSLEIARYIVASVDRDSGDAITPLKLQKLMFYIQAWALVFLDRPLFEEDFQAWAHGPALEDVYREYRDYGWNALPAPPSETVPELDEETAEHIQSIVSVYGDYSAKALEKMTHGEDPWVDARGDLPPAARSNEVISKDVMKAYYAAIYQRKVDGKE